jgi:hypothetical protein
MIEDADRFINAIPSDDVGFVFLDGDKPVQPEPGEFGRYQRRSGTRQGVWPSSPGISGAMLDSYRKPPTP